VVVSKASIFLQRSLWTGQSRFWHSIEQYRLDLQVGHCLLPGLEHIKQSCWDGGVVESATVRVVSLASEAVAVSPSVPGRSLCQNAWALVGMVCALARLAKALDRGVGAMPQFVTWYCLQEQTLVYAKPPRIRCPAVTRRPRFPPRPTRYHRYPSGLPAPISNGYLSSPLCFSSFGSFTFAASHQ
jgi:hypothetical protein